MIHNTVSQELHKHSSTMLQNTKKQSNRCSRLHLTLYSALLCFHWVLNEQPHGGKCQLPPASPSICCSKHITITALVLERGPLQSHPIIVKAVGIFIVLALHISEKGGVVWGCSTKQKWVSMCSLLFSLPQWKASVRPKITSMYTTDLGNYSINEKEGTSAFKYYCPIMPNPIQDLFSQLLKWLPGCENTQIMLARKQKTNHSGWAAELDWIYCQALSSV